MAAMVHSVALREMRGASKLLVDCWEGAESYRALVPRHFRNPEAFAEQRDLVQSRSYQRDTLRQVLKEQNAGFSAPKAVMENIERLGDPRAVVVIGGQQAGLFGGPLYTAHKALTVLALCEKLQPSLGCPVIPMFWIASDDHDLAEVSHTYITDASGKLKELTMSTSGDGGLPAGGDGKLPLEGAARLPLAGADRLPVSQVKLGPSVLSVLDSLETELPATEFSDGVLARLRAAYAAEATYPQSFGAWMSYLFGDSGLVLVDPADARLKELAVPLFKKEIAEKSPVSEAVIAQSARLAAAGYPAQIALRPDMLTLFYHNPGRETLTIKGDHYGLAGGGARFSLAELEAALESDITRFSPNAALRPLYQDTLLPTLCAVLGPSELAYYSQLSLAYERLCIPMPVLVPRTSVTLIEHKVKKLLDKYELSLGQVIAQRERIVDELARRGIPETLVSRLADGRRQVEEIWRELTEMIDKLDPTLRRTSELASGTSLRQFEFMEKKIMQAARKKDEILRGQVEKILGALCPNGDLQERSLCAVPFLVRYGKDILTRAWKGIDIFQPVHHGIEIDA